MSTWRFLREYGEDECGVTGFELVYQYGSSFLPIFYIGILTDFQYQRKGVLFLISYFPPFDRIGWSVVILRLLSFLFNQGSCPYRPFDTDLLVPTSYRLSGVSLPVQGDRPQSFPNVLPNDEWQRERKIERGRESSVCMCESERLPLKTLPPQETSLPYV